jgi:hypothetical protein
MSLNKKALLVGLNYTSTPQIQLRGCINDVIHISEVLMDGFDYDRSNIVELRDDSKDPRYLPTRANILNNLISLVNESANLSEIWFQYSGHGSQVKLAHTTELSGLDEVIVPMDYQKVGFIVDDEIFNIIKNSKCPTILLFDSCHSGSMCDLQYSFDFTNNSFKRSVVENKVMVNPNVFCFSGCKDNQTSADSFNPEQQLGVGAFTDAFIHSLRVNHFNVHILKLYMDICDYIKSNGYTQIPNLSSTTATPDYNFTRTTNTELKKTNLPIIQDVTPTPDPTPRPPVTVTVINVTKPATPVPVASAITKPATTTTVQIPTKSVNIFQNVYRKPRGGLGKMF